jgi:putative transposase
LNRGNGRSFIFDKEGDYEAFENILAEGLVRYPCRILSYQLMPNHWRFENKPGDRSLSWVFH